MCPDGDDGVKSERQPLLVCCLCCGQKSSVVRSGESYVYPSTPVERAVRRVQERTSTLSLQSRLDEHWWEEAMEAYCYFRNRQVLQADGKSLHERRYDTPFRGSLLPFGAVICNRAISTKTHEQASPIQPKSPQMFFCYWVLNTGCGWMGDLLVADAEELKEKHCNRKSPAKDSKKKGSGNPKRKGTIQKFPVLNGSMKSTEKWSESSYHQPESTLFEFGRGCLL